MENNLRIKEYVLNNIDNSKFNVRVWQDKFNNYMIVVGYYCFCNQKFDMKTRQIIIAESGTGSMLEKAQQLRNIYLNKELQYA